MERQRRRWQVRRWQVRRWQEAEVVEVEVTGKCNDITTWPLH